MTDFWSKVDAFILLPRSQEGVAAFLSEHPMAELVAQVEAAQTPKHAELGVACFTKLFHGDAGLAMLTSDALLPFVTRGLTHATSAAIRGLTLHHMERVVRLTGVAYFAAHDDVTTACTRALGDAELSVASHAMRWVSALAASTDGLALLGGSVVRACVDTLLDGSDDVVRLRVLDAFVRAATVSDAAFAFVHGAGMLHSLVTLLRGDDVLLQSNVFELVQVLLRSAAGVRFASEQDVVATMARVLKSGPSLELSLLGPHVLGCVGALLAQGADGVGVVRQAALLGPVIAAVDGDDEPVRFAAMSTVGMLGCSADALALASEEETSATALTAAVARWLNSPDRDQRIAAMRAWAFLLRAGQEQHAPRAPPLAGSDAMHALSQQLPHLGRMALAQLTREPFVEQRHAAFSLVHSLAHHEWGARMLVDTPGMTEFLLNRKTEHEKLGHEWKFTIVQYLGDAEFSSRVLSADLVHQFDGYVRDGVLVGHTDPHVRVATESN